MKILENFPSLNLTFVQVFPKQKKIIRLKLRFYKKVMKPDLLKIS